MPHRALLLHGVDPLFPLNDEEALGPDWAKRRFAHLIWPALWRTFWAVAFLIVGCGLVVRIDWDQTAAFVLPAVGIIAVGLWNALVAYERFCGAVAGHAMLAVLNSHPLRALFQRLAGQAVAMLESDRDAFRQVDPYGATGFDHMLAQDHFRLFGTDAVLVASLHARGMEQSLPFPRVCEPIYTAVIVDLKRVNRPFLWATIPKDPIAIPTDAHPLRFALLRWLAAKTELRSVSIGLPLTGNPQGSAHARMAFFNDLHQAAAMAQGHTA
jgi:hypothetical protein